MLCVTIAFCPPKIVWPDSSDSFTIIKKNDPGLQDLILNYIKAYRNGHFDEKIKA